MKGDSIVLGAEFPTVAVSWTGCRPEELLQDLRLIRKIKELKLERDNASAMELSFIWTGKAKKEKGWWAASTRRYRRIIMEGTLVPDCRMFRTASSSEMKLTHLDTQSGRQRFPVGCHYDGEKYFLRYWLSGLTEMEAALKDSPTAKTPRGIFKQTF